MPVPFDCGLDWVDDGGEAVGSDISAVVVV